MWTDRTEILVGKEGINKLKKSQVAVVGIGGVGGYVCLMLARCGIENLTLVDFDKVDETNINRQVVANTKTVGQFKTQIMKQQILEINPKCKVTTYDERLCSENIEQIITKNFDYVVDAIDDISNKVNLIKHCKEKNINIVSAMGAGNRIDVPSFKIMDIYKTCNDGLAKIMRKKLRENNIISLDVVISEHLPIKTENKEIGSIAYYPAMCGCVLSAFIVTKIIK